MSADITRRGLLAAGLATGLVLAPGVQILLGAEGSRRYRLGACDWSLGKRQDFGAFDVAKAIGLDGVQVSFDDVGKPTDLRLPEARAKYAELSQNTGVAICALAMGCLNQIPFATDDRTETWVSDCIDVMAQMNQKIVLLAFFGAGDIKGKPALQDKVIERLKRLAPRAEKAGVTLGLESWMNAEEHLRILDAVGSPSVVVYYDLCNMTTQKYDVPADIRKLKGRICQVHCKENGFLLGTGHVDFLGCRQALRDIDYQGWLVIEGATVVQQSLVACYRHNREFLDKTFN